MRCLRAAFAGQGTGICHGHAPPPRTPDTYLLDAATGAILTTLPTGNGLIFSQPIFAQGSLFIAKETGGLYDFAP
jgi:hypothetical protein